MSDKEGKPLATFTCDIFRLENGDFEPRFQDPGVMADTKYDYCKAALLAGEFMQFMKDQCVVLNADYESRIRKLSELIIDDEGWNKALKERDRVIPDTEKFQQPLPFKEKTDEDGS